MKITGYPNYPGLNQRELGTVLASLRYWQREGWKADAAEHLIASDGHEFEPLSNDEIDLLCERLNQ